MLEFSETLQNVSIIHVFKFIVRMVRERERERERESMHMRRWSQTYILEISKKVYQFCTLISSELAG